MMRDNYLDISKLTTNNKILKLFELFSRHGGVLRFVGGAVRDALKGVKGADLNLATDLSPDEIFEACSDEGIETIPLGIKQGSIGIKIDNSVVEVSSLCKFIENPDGTVSSEFTDNWEEDASRRDLTINAVYADAAGNVFDYYNGIEDLEQGIIRFIGSANNRIQEDSLRIMRYFRFYSMYGKGEPDKKSLLACYENRSSLKQVSMERIRDELFKFIQTPNAPEVCRLMMKNSIMEYIIPDAEYVDDFAYLNTVIGKRPIANLELIKLFCVFKPDFALAENFANRFRFSRSQKHLFTALAANQCTFDDFRGNNLVKTLYFHDLDFVLAKLLTLVAANHEKPDDLWDIFAKAEKTVIPQFPISGRDIIANSFNNGQKVGLILKELEKIWLDSAFLLTKEELIAEISNLKIAG